MRMLSQQDREILENMLSRNGFDGVLSAFCNHVQLTCPRLALFIRLAHKAYDEPKSKIQIVIDSI